MAKLSLQAGTTSKLLHIFIQNNSVTTGTGLTGLTSSSSGLIAYYMREGANADAVISLSAGSLGTWSSGGFLAVDGTNMPGLYELGVPNAAIASGAASVVIMLQGAANMAPLVLEIELTAVNNQSTGFGLVNASANVVEWNGAAVSSPATAGIPDVNVKNMNNVAATSITTINANQGTTQPINFTGTGASAYVQGDTKDIGGQAVSLDANNLLKVDVADWLGTAVASPATAGIPDINVKNIVNVAATLDANNFLKVDAADIGGQTATLDANNFLKVDVADILGTASAGAAGYVAPDWSAIHAPTTSVNLSGTTISTSQTVASVSGAVGSVTGNVGGNVAGSVNSVTSTVTANTTELAGQTITAAAGVTFPTSVASPTNITAGTITTVTNLTNAPTSGDFTSTMKTSLNNSTPAAITGAVGSVTGAVGSVTGNVGGSVASVTGNVGGSVGSVSGNVGGSVASVTAAVAVGTINATAAKYKINTAVNNFQFPMYSSTTGGEATGLTVTGNVSINGAGFTALGNSVTEIADGWYEVNLKASEMNGSDIALQFTATGAVTRDIKITTQP